MFLLRALLLFQGGADSGPPPTPPTPRVISLRADDTTRGTARGRDSTRKALSGADGTRSGIIADDTTRQDV